MNKQKTKNTLVQGQTIHTELPCIFWRKNQSVYLDNKKNPEKY